jgi:hypothetical protein
MDDGSTKWIHRGFKWIDCEAWLGYNYHSCQKIYYFIQGADGDLVSQISLDVDRYRVQIEEQRCSAALI